MTVFPMSNTSVDSTSVGSVNSSAGSGSEKKKKKSHPPLMSQKQNITD